MRVEGGTTSTNSYTLGESYIEPSISSDTKKLDFEEMKMLLENGGIDGEELQRLWADVEILVEIRDQLSVEEQKILDDFINTYSDFVQEYLDYSNTDNEDEDPITQVVKVIDAFSEYSAAVSKLLNLDKEVIKNLISAQMIFLYLNSMVVDMNNKSATTLTTLQKLYEKVTNALTAFQSFLGQLNAFYKDALLAKNVKGKDEDFVKDDPQGANKAAGSTEVSWDADGLAAYIQNNGNVYPPNEAARRELNNKNQAMKEAPIAAERLRTLREQQHDFMGGFMNPSLKISDESDEDLNKALRGRLGAQYYDQLVATASYTEQVQVDATTIYFAADTVPEIFRQYTTKVTLNGQDYYAINVPVMNKFLSDISLQLESLLPSDTLVADGSLYSLNQININKSLTLDTLITQCSNKMKIISEEIAKLNEKMRQFQNDIENVRQILDRVLNSFSQQTSKL